MRRVISFGLFAAVVLLSLFSVHAQAKQHSITLNWTASVTPTVTYNICRGTVAGGPYVTLQTGVAATTYVDASAAAGTKVFYVIDSVDAGGFASVHSNEVSATPVANPAPATSLTITVQ